MVTHAQLTARDIHGPYSQLLTNLQGDGGRVWLNALNRFLRKENPWDGRKLFPLWKTVRLGEFKTIADVKRIYEEKGFSINWSADIILSHLDCEFSKEPKEIDLVLVTPRELGVEGEDGCAPYFCILHALKLNGLESCPPEALIQARLVFPEQEYSGSNSDSDVMSIMKPFRIRESEFALELRYGDIDGEGTAAIFLGGFETNACEWDVDCSFLCVQPRE